MRVSLWQERNTCVHRCAFLSPFLWFRKWRCVSAHTLWCGYAGNLRLRLFATLRLRGSTCCVNMTVASTISKVCAFCQVKEDFSAWECYVCLACAGRRATPTAICEMCVGKALETLLGTRGPKLPPSFKCRVCITMESVRYREALAGDYRNRCDPMDTREDIRTVRPWMVDSRRAAPGETRSPFDARETLPPAG